jgi:putative transposase
MRPDDGEARAAMKAVAAERRRFGYRRIHIMLERQGIVMNLKKLRRLYREEKLQVRRRGGRKRALGTRRPMLLPDAPNIRWSLDFVSDALTDGRRFRVLAVVDDHSRECLALVADTSLSGHRVVRELDAVIARRGRPAMVVSDNGTELTSMAILSWCQRTGIEWHYIAPGKPMQNGFVESFMYRRPRGRKCFERDLHRPVRSCIRPVCAALFMTAGPDGVRGSRPHQRDALWRA